MLGWVLTMPGLAGYIIGMSCVQHSVIYQLIHHLSPKQLMNARGPNLSALQRHCPRNLARPGRQSLLVSCRGAVPEAGSAQ